jgi:hypothetical protein
VIRAATLLAMALVSTSVAERDTESHAIVMRAAVQDHFLPTPARPNLRFDIDARAAAPKTRIMFTAPLAAGAHQMQLEVAGGAGRTFVVATPLRRGRSVVTVSIVGQGRYDFGFWAGEPGAPGKEYRFTVMGPTSRTFRLDL